jgi:hypothetical protein
MADLNDYWKQVTSAESFQDLDDSEKEKVRNHLFEKYVQSSNSYIQLPQSQRLAVKKHYDEVTHIEPETLLQKGEKEVKKISKEVKPAIETAKKAVAIAPVAAESIEPAPMKAAYGMLEKGEQAISGAAKTTGEAIEPTEQEMISHAQKGSELTQFDKARLYASGAIQTAGDFIASAVPTDYFQMAMYPLADKVLEYAGTTFLGRDIKFWKPKTGLSSEAKGVGDAFEKALTAKRADMNSENRLWPVPLNP